MSNTVDSSVVSDRWVETTLGELAEYITSGSRDWSKYYAASGAIFIRTQDINRNRLSLNEVAFVKLPEKVEGKRSLVRKGDLLVTITGANVGKVAVVEGEILEAYVSQSVCLVRLKDPSLAKFVHLQLTAKRGDKTAVEAMAYGLGRPVLNLENIRSAPIRVAPAQTQVVVVAEIEKQFSRLDEAVANLKRVKANLKRYKAAVLKAAVEGKLTEDWRKQHPNVEPASKLLERILAERRAKWNGRGNYKEPIAPEVTDLPSLPKGWAWATVDQVAAPEPNSITDGPFGSNLKTEHYKVTGPRVIRLQNIGDGVFVNEEAHISEEHFAHLQKHRVFAGDLVIAALGEAPPRSCLIPQSVGPAIVKADCIRFKPHKDVGAQYLNVVLNSQPIRQRAKSIVHGVGRPRLNLGEIKAIVVPVPSTVEQQTIVAEVESRLSVIKEIEAAVEANLTRADRLRQSILSRAFSGDLVPMVGDA